MNNSPVEIFSAKPYFGSFALMLIQLFIVYTVNAQSPPAEKCTEEFPGLNVKKQQNTVELAFECPFENECLLVILRDSKGEIIFMENRRQFKGMYERSIDVSCSKDQVLWLQVSGDDKKFSRKLE